MRYRNKRYVRHWSVVYFDLIKLRLHTLNNIRVFLQQLDNNSRFGLDSATEYPGYRIKVYVEDEQVALMLSMQYGCVDIK